MEIRSDRMGDGHFAALRGHRRHYGIDIVVEPGEIIYSPVQGMIDRVFKPYATSHLRGIEIVSESMIVQLMYVSIADDSLIGKKVPQGDAIGLAQDVRDVHGPKMIPHVHLQVYYNPVVLLDNWVLSWEAPWWLKIKTPAD